MCRAEQLLGIGPCLAFESAGKAVWMGGQGAQCKPAHPVDGRLQRASTRLLLHAIEILDLVEVPGCVFFLRPDLLACQSRISCLGSAWLRATNAVSPSRLVGSETGW